MSAGLHYRDPAGQGDLACGAGHTEGIDPCCVTVWGNVQCEDCLDFRRAAAGASATPEPATSPDPAPAGGGGALGPPYLNVSGLIRPAAGTDLDDWPHWLPIR
jgi:hypothetical protein